MTTTLTRIAALDVLRGVAILGTFASNAWLFAAVGGPGALLTGGGTPGGGGAETVLLALSNGKFLALLTLLFGVGVELQYRSAVRRGLPVATAQTLVREGMAGTAELLRHYDGDTLALRRAVTSPGGSTARGLAALERRGVRAALAEAMDEVVG